MTRLPEVDPATGFVPTLNRMGGMSPTLDDYSRRFVEAAAAGQGLDVGAAYGLVTRAALDRGARMVAIDLEPRHLEVLLDQTPTGQRDRLTLVSGRFPDDLDLAADSLDAVLLARMLHFMDGPSIDAGLAAVARWLRPGGQVFGVAVTPHLAKLVPFQAEYQRRRAAGEAWPGWVADVSVFDPEGARGLPSGMNFLDPEVLTRAVTRAGLVMRSEEAHV